MIHFEYILGTSAGYPKQGFKNYNKINILSKFLKIWIAFSGSWLTE